MDCGHDVESGNPPLLAGRDKTQLQSVDWQTSATQLRDRFSMIKRPIAACLFLFLAYSAPAAKADFAAAINVDIDAGEVEFSDFRVFVSDQQSVPSGTLPDDAVPLNSDQSYSFQNQVYFSFKYSFDLKKEFSDNAGAVWAEAKIKKGFGGYRPCSLHRDGGVAYLALSNIHSVGRNPFKELLLNLKLYGTKPDGAIFDVDAAEVLQVKIKMDAPPHKLVEPMVLPAFSFSHAVLAKVTEQASGEKFISVLEPACQKETRVRTINVNGKPVEESYTVTIPGPRKRVDYPLADVDCWLADGKEVNDETISQLLATPRSVFWLASNQHADYCADPFFEGLINPNAIVIRLNRDPVENTNVP